MTKLSSWHLCFVINRDYCSASASTFRKKMKILIVEDEKKVAAFVKAGLEERGFVAEVCHNGDDAAEVVMTQPFDVIIMDIMLPGRDGLSVLRRMRDAKNTTPVILLTARGDLNERVEGLDRGADDYLAKPFAMIELIARLNAVLRRRTGTGLTILAFEDLTLNLTTREVKRAGKKIDLTPREFSLLECLMRTPGKVVTRVEISQTVWGHNFSSGTNFVDVAVQRLRRKIDDMFSKKIVQTVRGLGYALQSE